MTLTLARTLVQVCGHKEGSAWFSRRPFEPGLDFYGRPTEALWFHLPVSSRRWIAALLNLGWIAHFTTVGTHSYFWTYVQLQTWPGTLANNLPFALSVLGPALAGVIQGKAEDRVCEEQPTRFPPKWSTYMKAARAKWRAAGRKGSFLAFVREELQHFKDDVKGYQAERPQHKTTAFSGIVSAVSSKSKLNLSPGATSAGGSSDSGGSPRDLSPGQVRV